MYTTNEQRRRDALNQRLTADAINTRTFYPMEDIAPKIVREEIKARVEANPFERTDALKKALKRSEPLSWRICEGIGYASLIVALLSIVAYSFLTHSNY